MKRITVKDFIKKKRNGEKLTLVTCYDYTFARIIEDSGNIDGVLVGDSLGMVVKGERDTLGVSIDEIAYHTMAVRRGLETPLLIADMPFGSYHQSVEYGIKNAVRLIKAGADAVKVEGGSEVVDLIEKLVSLGIPVMGHLGMTPQYKNIFGGYRLQGKDKESKERIIEDARRLERAGVFSIVLEMVPESLGRTVKESVEVPVIGIGAGRYTDGQILVIYDLLGLFKDIEIRFVRQYAQGYELFKDAIRKYADDVKDGKFPGEENVYS